MGILSVILVVVFSVNALLLIFIVLIQDEQGDGIGGLFGGGSSSAFGSTSGNFLTRLTTILGASFLVISLALGWLNRSVDGDDLIRAARTRSASENSGEWWITAEEEEATATPSEAPGVDLEPSTQPE